MPNQTGASIAASITDQWKECEDKLRAQVAKSLDLYWTECRLTGKKHKFISTAMMILGIATPLLVAEAAKEQPIFELGSRDLQAAAFLAALSLALLEGFRRIGRFERRWADSYRDASDIKRARDGFEIDTVGHPVGTDEWIKSFRDFRAAYHAVVDRDIGRFSGADEEPKN